MQPSAAWPITLSAHSASLFDGWCQRAWLHTMGVVGTDGMTVLRHTYTSKAFSLTSSIAEKSRTLSDETGHSLSHTSRNTHTRTQDTRQVPS